jgi:hypothetical protein
MVSKGYDTKAKLDAVEDSEVKKMKTEALKYSDGAYLGCLFLMMADERYKPVKEFLHQAFLAENQQYPRDTLTMKRFTADFIGATIDKPKQPQQQPTADLVGGTGVVSISPDKKSKRPWPVCHACGKQHKGNWEKCNQISETVRANIDMLVKTGAFNNTSNDSHNKPTVARTIGGNKSPKQKRGAANTVVKEKENGEETEIKEDGMPTQEPLLQMFGISTTLVGNANNIEELIAMSKGCLDGNTLPNPGFTNIQVGGGVPIMTRIMKIKIKECQLLLKYGKYMECMTQPPSRPREKSRLISRHVTWWVHPPSRQRKSLPL